MSLLKESKNQDIPWWEKFTLTIKEAAEYYNIDEDDLRDIVKRNSDESFVFKTRGEIRIVKNSFETWYYKIQSFLPWWEKYSLSIEEASVYYNIGTNKLRTLINNNPELDFIVRIGKRTTINRKKFEKWYDQVSDL